MPSEYQQDYKKTRAYAPKIYNDPNMCNALRDIYKTLESRYVHEGRTIDPSFYNDLNDDSVAKFTAIGFDCLLALDEEICPSSSKTNLPNFKRKRKNECQVSNQCQRTSALREQPNQRHPSPPPRKKSLSPLQALSKSISSKSVHYTSSSSPSESPTPTDVAPPPKLHFIILIKQEPQELPPLHMSPNNPYVLTMDNWPPSPCNPSPPLRVSRPPLGFPNPPPRFELLPSTQPMFVNINNNTPHLHNNAPLLETIHHPPPNLGNQDFPNPLKILNFVHPNDMPHLHNTFCQCCSTTRHEIKMLQNRVNYMFSYIRHHLGPSSNPPYFPH
ncbi:hypothetical protein Tco_0960396 [Tanacetum coccineum]